MPEYCSRLVKAVLDGFVMRVLATVQVLSNELVLVWTYKLLPTLK